MTRQRSLMTDSEKIAAGLCTKTISKTAIPTLARRHPIILRHSLRERPRYERPRCDCGFN